MEWTSEKPSRAGWYWRRNIEEPVSAGIVMTYYSYSGYLSVQSNRVEWEHNYEWSSEPIPEPKESA